jgi:hypothetical protein
LLPQYISPAEAAQRRTDPAALGFKEYDPRYVVKMKVQGGDLICVDAGLLGNVSRLFNHSCAPSLTTRKVRPPPLEPSIHSQLNLSVFSLLLCGNK